MIRICADLSVMRNVIPAHDLFTPYEVICVFNEFSARISFSDVKNRAIGKISDGNEFLVTGKDDSLLHKQLFYQAALVEKAQGLFDRDSISLLYSFKAFSRSM
jgi:hypothetical protein